MITNTVESSDRQVLERIRDIPCWIDHLSYFQMTGSACTGCGVTTNTGQLTPYRVEEFYTLGGQGKAKSEKRELWQCNGVGEIGSTQSSGRNAILQLIQEGAFECVCSVAGLSIMSLNLCEDTLGGICGPCSMNYSFDNWFKSDLGSIALGYIWNTWNYIKNAWFSVLSCNWCIHFWGWESVGQDQAHIKLFKKYNWNIVHNMFPPRPVNTTTSVHTSSLITND